MKRFLIIAAAAGAILVSCAKTETVNVSDAKYIGFDNAYIGNPTKAVEEVSTTNIDHFYVFGGYNGTTVFENVEVSKSANAWTYTNQKPWVDDEDYKFAAYYDDEPLTTTTNVSFDYASGHLTLTDIVINPDNQVDMLYAENNFGNSGATGTVRDKVQFSFSHILSMVQFTINSGFGDGVNVTVTDFDFSGMESKATYSFVTDKMKWSDAADEIAENNGFKLFQTDNIATVNGGVSKPAIDNCIVMPQGLPTGENIKATFTVTVTGTGITEDGTTNTKNITAIIPLGADKSWEPGYRYNYIATIDGQTMNYIEFDAPEVSLWTNENINMVNGTTDGQIVGQ